MYLTKTFDDKKAVKGINYPSNNMVHKKHLFIKIDKFRLYIILVVWN